MQYYVDGFRPGDPDVKAPALGREQPQGGVVPETVDVLIAGCGPAGLCLAAQLAGFPQISTMIVEPKHGPMEKGQADGVNVRSMEMFQAFGFADKVKREAYWVNQTAFWKPDPSNTDHITRVGIAQDVADDQSEMPHTIVNQARIHQLFLDVMKKSPTRLEPHYGLRVMDLEIDTGTEDHPVTVTLERVNKDGSAGDRLKVRANYVVGCDGARSNVRRAIGGKLHGDAAHQAWGVMDNAIVFAAASLCSALLLWGFLRFVLGEAQPSGIILALGGATANSIFLGFPIASVVFPERATEVFSWVVFAEVAIIMPTVSTLALLAEGQHDGAKVADALKALLVSPVSIGLVAGFAFLAMGLSLPEWLDKVVSSIVASAPFIALFVIGGSILQFQVSRSGPRVIAITVAKLLIHPLFVGLAFLVVFGPQVPATREAILFASMPLFLSYVVFCGRHGVGEVGASAIVVSTVVGAVTVTMVLAMLF